MSPAADPSELPSGPPLQRKSELPFPVVGIGGSAGAIAALLRFFGALPARTGMAYVVVLHLSPDHESNAADVLQRATRMPVAQVRNRMRLEPDHVYVIPPGLDLLTQDGHVQPATRIGPRGVLAAIDFFFRTLADVHKDHAIGIVLSGTGSDGSVGLSRIKEEGGITLAQAPDDCEFGEMPTAAIQTETVDLVLGAAELAGQLVALWNNAQQISLPAANDAAGAGIEAAADAALSDVLSLLRVHTRNDFRHYKRATVLRRIARRMQIHGLADIAAYREHFRRQPEEARPLLQDMLISVTSFFRDPQVFDSLERSGIPVLFTGRKPGEDIRVWVAGCATGEESYSVAMLLREHADRIGHAARLQIFATDINERALAFARQGSYPGAIAADVSAVRLARFFQPDGDQHRVTEALRDEVLFARHNLLADPPFSRIDLICCRNLLIYLDAAAQKTVLEMFSYALRPGGLLLLGNAESTDGASHLFAAVDAHHRLYRLNADVERVARAPLDYAIATVPVVPPPPSADDRSPSMRETPVALLHQRALLQLGPPSVLIDQQHDVLHLSGGADAFVGRGQGVPSNDLLDNIAADIRVELRSALFKAEEGNVGVTVVVRRQGSASAGQLLQLAVHPVHEQRPGDTQRRWLVVFTPLTHEPPRPAGAGGAADASAVDALGAQNRELKLHLEESLDRFAASSEASKASNEELQAINEELRSATEELETSKEELQSMNEELTTVNHELRLKVEESARTNDDLRNLMAASDIATVFVDGDLHVKRFTPGATRLFQLIAADVGRPLLDIRSRLRYPELEDDTLAAYRELRIVERRLDGADGRRWLARVLPYRTAQNRIEGAVLTFVEITPVQQAEDRMRRVEERLREAVQLSADYAVIANDDDGVITSWNAGAQKVFGYSGEEIIGQPIDILYVAEDRAAGVPAIERRQAADTGRGEDERWHLRKDGGVFYCSGVLTPHRTDAGVGFVKIARDATHGKRIDLQKDEALHAERERSMAAKAAVELKDRFLAVMSHELKQPLNLIQVNAELLTRLPESKPLPAVLRIGQTIQRAVGSQTQIVDDLLDLSRIQTGKLRLNLDVVDLAERVRVLAEAATIDAERKGVLLEVRGAVALPCRGDSVRIEQIVWNLLGNAIKFTPAGGRIVVEVQPDGECARLTVADTGPGITADFLPHVFDMFSQSRVQAATRASGSGGLGIGLALVDELARAHGGHAEAASPGPGQGSVFSVWLPLASAPVPDTAPAAPGIDLAGARVLVVDDDADSVATFALLLEFEGASVDIATSGADALARIDSGGYGLLISDLSMPDMDGYTLIGRVRQLASGRRLKALAVSGFGREVDADRALRAGFDGHLSKPASMEQVKAALAGI